MVDTMAAANIGLACGGKLVVIDVDPRHGGDKSLSELEAQHGAIETVCVNTGGGGSHLYLSPNGTQVRGRIGLMPGIDIKSNGCYVVAPPSRHISGKLYQWEETAPRELTPVPAWLVELTNNGAGNRKALFDNASALAGVPEGKRDETCFKLACKL
jgi:hypothetical protein